MTELQLKKYNCVKDLMGKKIVLLGASKKYIEEIEAAGISIDDIIAILALYPPKKNYSIYNEKKIIPVIYIQEFLENIGNKWNEVFNCEYMIADGYYREYYDVIKDNIDFLKHIDHIWWFPNLATKEELIYREKYNSEELKDIIIFRSGPKSTIYVEGMDFSDNSRALFQYMLDNGYNKKYELVWFVHDPSMFERYNNVENVTFVGNTWADNGSPEQKDEYYRVLCQAKYIFTTEAIAFARNCRPDQIRVELWHGSGIKDRTGNNSQSKRYEYMTVVSNFYAEIFRKAYDLRPEQLLVTGYAKEDYLFEEPRKEIFDELNIPKAEKYVLWLPTFRYGGDKSSAYNTLDHLTETGLPILDSLEKIEEMNNICKERGIQIIIKLHPIQDRTRIADINASNIVIIETTELARKDIQINQLMPLTDALISDYSSAAIDYMHLDRPIAFLVEDKEEFGENRRFLFNPIEEWLPGDIINNCGEFKEFLVDLSNGVDRSKDKRHQRFSEIHSFNDGNSRKRILDAVGVDL